MKERNGIKKNKHVFISKKKTNDHGIDHLYQFLIEFEHLFSAIYMSFTGKYMLPFSQK